MEISIGAVSRFGCMLSCEGEEGGGGGERSAEIGFVFVASFIKLLTYFSFSHPFHIRPLRLKERLQILDVNQCTSLDTK